MNENAIHGAPKRGREWRIALSNHYAWLQTRGWRMDERKCNSWGSEKGGAADEPVKNDPDDILRLVVASLIPGGQDTATLSGADGSFEYRCVQAVGQVSICVWKEPDNSGFVAANGRSPADTLTLTHAVRDAIES